uniref:Zinc finger protein 207 n=1 Tax=Steinernema glaseri TaxID=37863 RepID=A0A1I7YRN4_9BILA
MTEAFLFTTDMANRASDSVRQGECQSIFEWHKKNVSDNPPRTAQTSNDENVEPKPEPKVEVSPLMRMQQMADEQTTFPPPAKKAAVDPASTQKKFDKLEEIEMSLGTDFKKPPMSAPFPMGVRPGHPAFRGPFPGGPYPPPPHMMPPGMGPPGYPPGFGGYPPMSAFGPRMNSPGSFPPGTMGGMPGMPPHSVGHPGMPPVSGSMNGMPPVSGPIHGMPYPGSMMPPYSNGMPPGMMHPGMPQMPSSSGAPPMPSSSQAFGMPPFPMMPPNPMASGPQGMHPNSQMGSAAPSPAMPHGASPFYGPGPHSVPLPAGATSSPAFPPNMPSRPHSAAVPQSFAYGQPGQPGQHFSPAFGGMMPPPGTFPNAMQPPFPS